MFDLIHIHPFQHYLALEMHSGHKEHEIHKDTFKNDIYLHLQNILK
jgi:hypothetical protein